ncbi:MAG: toll/interleukin-1 receptor domain-containing protein [Vicinamibacterales bacterium]
MSFERDVFISYAHDDNQPFTPEQKGWVTLFHTVLRTMLSQRMGKTADIWRDERLQGNEDFSTEIHDQFPKTATLVSVLTPRYLKSGWCTKEIKVFCQVAERNGGLFVRNKGRVFKVMKTPVARTDTDGALPPEVGKATGYEFFEKDKDIEFDPAYGEGSRQEFLVRIRRLAGDIAELLGQMSDAIEPGGSSVESEGRPRVYLAECGTSRKYDREKLIGDLKSHGYVVLPNEDLPDDEAGYVAEVERLLAQCQLSVHLIGNTYGTVPDGDSQKSSVVLQNEIAVTRSRAGGLLRLISLPEGLSSTNSMQQAFIDALLKNSEMQFGADLVNGDLQTVIGSIHAALKKIEQPRPVKTSAAEDGGQARKTVHVLHEEKDGKDTIPLLKHLLANGLAITRPLFSGEDAGKQREANQALYMACDAVILFYGTGDQTWKYYRQTELKKLRGLRGDKPLLAEFTYVAAPGTTDKELLVSIGEGDVIDGLNGLSDAGMAPFIRAIAPAGGGK